MTALIAGAAVEIFHNFNYVNLMMPAFGKSASTKSNMKALGILPDYRNITATHFPHTPDAEPSYESKDLKLLFLSNFRDPELLSHHFSHNYLVVTTV